MKLKDFFDSEYIVLIKAIQKHDERRAAILLEGLTLNVHGEEGITPLLWLIMQKDKQAIQLALKLGADVNFARPQGGNALTMAIGGNDDDLVKLLLDNGGDPNSTDHNGFPALFHAIGFDRPEQVELLIEHGVDIQQLDRSKRTAAMYGSNLNKFKWVHYLLMKGINYEQRGTTRADLAWKVHDKLSENLIDKKSSTYGWAIKVKKFLIDKGVEFPPMSPRDVRFAEGTPNQWDIKAKAKEDQEN